MPTYYSPNLSATAFLLEACEMLQFPPNRTMVGDERGYRALFGVSPEGTADIWKLAYPHLKTGTRPKHLLWTLLLQKVHATEDVLCKIARCDRKSFRKWVWPTMKAMRMACPKVVSKCNRNDGLAFLFS